MNWVPDKTFAHESSMAAAQISNLIIPLAVTLRTTLGCLRQCRAVECCDWKHVLTRDSPG